MPSIHLAPAERQDLLAHYRRPADPEVRHRSHILVPLDAGHPWATVSAVLFRSVGTINRWTRRFVVEGVDAVIGRPRGRRRSGVHVRAAMQSQQAAIVAAQCLSPLVQVIVTPLSLISREAKR